MPKFRPLKATSAVFAGLLALGSGLAAAGTLPGHMSPISATAPDQTDVSATAEAGITSVTDTGSEVTADETEQHDTDQGTIGEDDQGDNDQGTIDDANEAEHDDDQGTIDGNDQGDNDQGDNDQGTIGQVDPGDSGHDDQGAGDPAPVAAPVHPDNHGAAVSAVAHQNDETDATEGNHGAAVSAVAHQKSGHDDGDNEGDHSVSTPPAVGTSSSTATDDDDDQGDVEDHDDADGAGHDDADGADHEDGAHHGNGHDNHEVEND